MNPIKELHFRMVLLIESVLQSHKFFFKGCINPDSVYFRELAFFSLWLSHC